MWALDLPDDPVSVTGDPDRLHQVVANLLTNARVHTPPGTVVSLGIGPVADAMCASRSSTTVREFRPA